MRKIYIGRRRKRRRKAGRKEGRRKEVVEMAVT